MKIIDKFKIIILNEFKENNIHCYLAGGCLRDSYLYENFKDIDLFFKNEIEYKKAIDYFIKNDAKKIETSRFGFKFIYKNHKFDLINKHFNSIQDVLNDFDLTVCMIGIENEQIYFGETTENDLKDKLLILHDLSNVGNTINRINLHVHKSFRLPLKEIKKLSEFIKDDIEKMQFAQAMFIILTKNYNTYCRLCNYLKIKQYYEN